MKAVFYSDAGFLYSATSKGASGYGVHGYTFTDEPPKKGTGNPKVIPTNLGYVGPIDAKGTKLVVLKEGEKKGPKDLVGEKVTVDHYVEIVGGARGHGSSSEAELNAMVELLKYLKEHPELKDIRVWCDNQVVVGGFQGGMFKWCKNNWITTSGKVVMAKPKWIEAKALWEEISEETKIRVEKIKGHNGNVGNNAADELATKGINGVLEGREETVIKVLPADKYWSPKVEIPRLLVNPRWYFSSNDVEQLDDDGKVVFHVGAHGTKDKELELTGKPYCDNFLGVIHVAEPPELTKQLREYVGKNPNAGTGKVVVGHMDHILKAKAFTDFDKYELDYHRKSSKRIHVKSPEKTDLILEMTPQGQGFRMAKIWTQLDNKLKLAMSDDKSIQKTDITDILYEPQGKQDKLKLKGKWTQRIKYFDVKPTFNLAPASSQPEPFEHRVRLIFGADILSRNNLAAIAPDVERVSVITWRDSSQVGRYAVMIEMTNGDYGVWTRYEANFILK